VPTIGTQFIDTTVTVKNADTIVLGGLITEDATRNETGVPILKDIPLLGYLFKGVTKEKKRSELIILIQPNVVGPNEEINVISEQELSRSKIGAEAKAVSDNVPFVEDKKKKAAEKKTIMPARGLSTPEAVTPTPTPTLAPEVIPLTAAP
jgi:type II secretory pathway component GspD/PulD (secretin)